MGKLLRCDLCGNREFLLQKDLIAHYEIDHHNAVKDLYLEDNLTRRKLADLLNLGENGAKELLRLLEVKKSRDLVMRNTWRNSSQESKVRRIAKATAGRSRTYADSARLQERHREIAQMGADASREASKVRAAKIEKTAFKELDEGNFLSVSEKNSRGITPWKIYRAWRVERATLFCDICESKSPKRKTAFLIDHHHQSGRIRGLLCYSCNSYVGWVEKHQGLIANYRSKDDTVFIYSKTLLRDPSFPHERGDLRPCGICGKIASLGQYSMVIDHNHKTGMVRGFLCHGCNVLLGRLENNDAYELYIKKEIKGEVIKW